ncbi:prolipoprotein diacylglyceryl transferase family protein [Maribacter sp.]|uniref:prolipoprotein diacylglyceryl transferase n=1 Tax=Maribacter sp. TaxID=1897614 RepID=UPI0025C201F9|nr:prolipoprotein diacylglyceryl transferase family protein [Maribacter sp.]
MNPKIFNAELPSFLWPIFGEEVTLFTYATCIVLGTFIASLYTKWRAKKELGIIELPNWFFYSIFIAGFVGGKVFFYLERPIHFYNNPSEMLHNFSGGFVFYGSFITIIPYIIWYLKKHKIPVLPMLDILAVTTTIVHSIGRFGCFNAGCCYGSSTDSSLGIIFPASKGITVHPTQLYEVTLLLIIMVLLLTIKRWQQFNGQIFLTYLMLYAFGRGVLEIFRGDNRGYIVSNVLSHSQFIAICLIAIAVFFYIQLKSNQNIKPLNP